jgi:Domain of unknown function (DUF4282)
MSEQGSGQGQPDYGWAQGQEAGYSGQGAAYQGQGAAHPGQTQGHASPPRGSSKGFVASLFDFGFESFVTPKVVKVVYVLIMILIGLSALGFLAVAFHISVAFGIIALVILCPLYFFVYVALWRIALEIFMVIFRISDDVRSIRERGDLR